MLPSNDKRNISLFPGGQTLLKAGLAGVALACLAACNQPQELEKPQVSPPIAPQKVCVSASKEQATALLTRLFPESKLLAFDPLALDDTKSMCLLEVDMLVNKDAPSTRGFVYVLPDGERFLNGPLMDKRSRIELQSAAPPPAPQDLAASQHSALMNLAKQVGIDVDSPAFSLGDTPPAEPESPTSGAPAASRELNRPSTPANPGQAFTTAPAPAQSEAASAGMREQLLASLKDLPAITYGEGKKDVYVMFDPECPYCRRLFGQNEVLSARYDLKIHWIPIFLNEKSWAMSAFLLKTKRDTPDAAMPLLKKMMDRTWDPVVDAAGINSMKDPEYAVARNSTLVFAKAAKQSPVLGTPLVVFKTPDNSIEVISGLPNPADWSVLDTQTPPATAPST